MKPVEANIVHESQTNRQHVRMKMPARAYIGDKVYAVRDLSSAGLGIEGVGDGFKQGDKINFQLALPFDSFTLDVALQAIVRHYSSVNKTLGLQMENLTPQQVSILNHVIKAYIAGDVVVAGDVLAVATRDNFVKLRKAANSQLANASLAFRTRQLIGTGVIAVVGLIVGAYVLNNFYQMMFVLKTSESVVQANVITLNALGNGSYKSILGPADLRVKEGQPMAEISLPDAIDPTKARIITITSPCDCQVVKTHLNNGEYAEQGKLLFQLVREDASPWVSANLPLKEAYRVQLNNTADIRIAGTDLTFTGHVSDIGSNFGPFGVATQMLPGLPIEPQATITIEMDQKIPVAYIGRPAYVAFNSLKGKAQAKPATTAVAPVSVPAAATTAEGVTNEEQSE